MVRCRDQSLNCGAHAPGWAGTRPLRPQLSSNAIPLAPVQPYASYAFCAGVCNRVIPLRKPCRACNCMQHAPPGVAAAAAAAAAMCLAP